MLAGSPGSAAAADDEVTPLTKGDAAPFTGDLFPPELSLRLGLRVEHCEAQKAAEVTRVVRLGEIELQAERDKAAVRKEANAARLAALQRALDEATPWYRDPWFVATLTAVVTVSGVVFSVYIYNEIARSLQP